MTCYSYHMEILNLKYAKRLGHEELIVLMWRDIYRSNTP